MAKSNNPGQQELREDIARIIAGETVYMRVVSGEKDARNQRPWNEALRKADAILDLGLVPITPAQAVWLLEQTCDEDCLTCTSSPDHPAKVGTCEGPKLRELLRPIAAKWIGPIIFETQTSTYGLVKLDDGQFRLTKYHIKLGMLSNWPAGVERTATPGPGEFGIFIHPNGCLQFGNWNTSPVKDVEALRAWLEKAGVQEVDRGA